MKCLQDRHSIPRKPAILPVSSLQEMDAFENISDEDYSDVVSTSCVLSFLPSSFSLSLFVRK